MMKWGPGPYLGFDPTAFLIPDGTDIRGYFQSEKYIRDPSAVKAWFTLTDQVRGPIEAKYRHIDFDRCCSMHLRFGDMLQNLRVHTASRAYYRKAVDAVPGTERMLVFSDDQALARGLLAGMDREFVFMEGNESYADLHLASLCTHNICSVSTLSWWAAWLNQHPDKVVVAPHPRYLIGAPHQNPDIWPAAWKRVHSGRRFWDLHALRRASAALRRRKARWRGR